MRVRRVAGALAGGFGATVAAVPFAARKAMRRPKANSFESGGTRIHYTEHGDGEPLVLLHGFAVNGDLNWRLPGLQQKLAEEFRVIVPDQRGHGASGSAPAYGIAMVDDLRRLLDHLGVDRAHVAGYSLGGVVTLKFATSIPGDCSLRQPSARAGSDQTTACSSARSRPNSKQAEGSGLSRNTWRATANSRAPSINCGFAS